MKTRFLSVLSTSLRYLVYLSTCLLVTLLLFGAQPASADGVIIPEPPPGRPIPWREIPLTIKYHRVDVTIADQVATTHVDQVFVNDAGFPVEGTYIFPLPEDAAISSFDMWVDGQKLEGKLLGREEARAIYEDIVRRQRDPALLEYVGRGAFQARIFPIPPGGERRIELTYSQALVQDNGLVHYRYPLNTEKFSARPIANVSVTVHLADKSPLRAIYSPSHPVDVVREGDRRATISFEAKDVRPDRDFDLYYSLSYGRSPTEPSIALNLLSYKPPITTGGKPFDEDGFFLLLVTPPVEVPGAAVVAKDVVLVLDTSGSMAGEKLQQAQAAATYVLDHLGAEDRFNIVSFSTVPRLFADAPVSADRVADGRAFIQKLTAQGSTDINRALLEALAGADPARPTVLIFLTDGLPTAGEVDPDHIIANVGANAPKSVRLFAFGVGYDVDTMLLDQLSSGQRGTSAYVRPGEKIDEAVSGFYAKVSTPVLVDVSLDFAGVKVEDLYPYPLPDLFAGSQLVVAGRYRAGGTATLTLRGEVNPQGASGSGQPQTQTYPDLTFVNRGGNEFIPQLWAQRKIGYLLTQIRLHGAKDELVKEVVALSTRFGIVTPYTSFLVQEPRMALTQGGRDQLSRDLQQAPTPAAAPGMGGAAPAAPAAPALAPSERSGEQAVERALEEHKLSGQDYAAGPAVEQVKQVGDKAFVLHEGVWLDTGFDTSKMRAEAVAFGSDRYFQLLTQYPEIGRYLALGDRVTVVLAGKAYAIGPEGGAAAAPAAPATPAPAAPATPAPAAQPAPAAPSVCAGAAALGAIGAAAPVWLRGRRGGS
jgi:Ca-activated chloride channel family protein